MWCRVQQERLLGLMWPWSGLLHGGRMRGQVAGKERRAELYELCFMCQTRCRSSAGEQVALELFAVCHRDGLPNKA